MVYRIEFEVAQFNSGSEDTEDTHESTVKTIFDMLYDLLAVCESSNRFNYLPGTDDADGVRDYFEGKFGEVQKVLEKEFGGKPDSIICQKLNRIIGETKRFIECYSELDTVTRWRKINPALNYFDCAFDMIDELGLEEVQQLNRLGLLAYFPSVYEIKARELYLAANAFADPEDNSQRSEVRIYQNELLQTLALVFAHDFRVDGE